MNALRAILAALGVGVAVAGLAMIADPSLAGSVPSSKQIVQIVGIIAGLQGGRILWHRYRSEQRAGTVEDDPETTPAGPSPGTAFDELASAAGNVDSGRTLRSRRNRLRRRLRRAIVASLRRHRDLDREAATEAVETGTWTDDPTAAALFTDDVAVDDSPGLLPGMGTGPLTRRSNHAALAVADLVGVETGDLETPDSDETERRRATGRRDAGAGDWRASDADGGWETDAAGEPETTGGKQAPVPGAETDVTDGKSDGSTEGSQ